MVLGPAGNRIFFAVWAAPAAPNTIPEGGGAEALHLLEGFWGAAGAAETPQIDDFRPAQKPCIKHPSVHQLSSLTRENGSRPSCARNPPRTAKTKVMNLILSATKYV